MRGFVETRGGQVVHTAGDSFLAEFPSIADVAECALEIQRELAACNAGFEEARKVQFRIGLNMGDVLHEGDDIHGDGVNVAARLEALADPGGICVSRAIFEHIRPNLACASEDLGEHAVKNISTPVHVYRLCLDKPTGESAVPLAAPAPAAASEPPSIIVLPFENLSHAAEEDYFTDGITEDIITELSRLASLTVIARVTAFSYKGRAVKLAELGQELGVRYVLEGSVRRAGERVRITTRLEDTREGTQLWAERFDRELADVFEVQDEITGRIMATLPQRVENAEIELAKRKPQLNMAAYDYVLRGKYHHHRVTAEDNAMAVEALEKAGELEPDNAQAHAWLACTYGQAWARGFIDTDFVGDRCVEEAERALACDDKDHECHRILSEVGIVRRDFERAKYHSERAIELNPNDPRILSLKSEVLTWTGRAAEGLPWMEKALQLDPAGAQDRLGLYGLGLFAAGRESDAIDAFERITEPQAAHYANLAACHARLGAEEPATRYADRTLAANPAFSIAGYAKWLFYQHEENTAAHVEALRLFGGVGPAHPRVSLELRAAKARRSRVTLREQAHIDAFERAASGEMSQAGQMWDAILREHPNDMMAAKCAHEAYYLVGEGARLRQSVLDILPAWNEDMPYYGYLLGMGAFGLEEAGDYREAEEMGRRAVEIEPRDAWGVHAVAHTLQMEGRCREGIAWLENTHPGWEGAVWLAGHLWWHMSLPLIDAGMTDRVVEIFDQHVSDCDQDMVTRLNDCSSLLWRLELAGVDVDHRWDKLIDMWMHHIDEHAIAFCDAHLAMTMASAGGEKKLGRFLQSQRAYLEGADHSTAAIIREVGQPLCQGVIAYSRGDYAAAADHIGPVLGQVWRIGGSNAQRDLFRMTLCAALIESGRYDEAHELLEPMVAREPTPALLRDLAAA